ncbi:DNA-binding helix-turn-helix protein (plasmid) [Limosilactobacillus reuteri I5007]|jgi:DNA-binding XRE family transcriptional regulator|uniref:Helix-turn-helix transcriptional regulator n=2 Tax=Limosilactobacillus reuteri TaxID=1598 RepID=A0A7L6BH76_LIMRT|nr:MULTISPECIES: helix-turn-helix transcriptional regulator [Limosilactobacillus]AGO00170.1 DNA-binding helix-turn-helix protein [Limosilactobacillus reuteri I5007]MBU5284301.1 helix-turn-helix transcriptional regulator [Limosilactobacillus reuteri]MCD7125459.1 helix-turn-helix transcriptional regulator [Limosilactobacillus caviae]OTA43587.1 transcriptional regulator [Limosilactobacillus reuteri]OTA48673.1 transcriptional regulator [Limosilactobacillus reuteri]
MAGNVNFKDYLNQQLQDPQFKQEFENETTKLESAIAVTHVRKEAGLTQRELANVSKVPQSTIARIETGANTSVDTLTKIANALGKKLTVSFS